MLSTLSQVLAAYRDKGGIVCHQLGVKPIELVDLMVFHQPDDVLQIRTAGGKDVGVK
ncbi:hypothetical protein D3C73_977130 [compost metagenome]